MVSTVNISKPQPRINRINGAFWTESNARALVIQKCLAPACGKWFYFPRVGCPHCGSTDYEWAQASGNGTIISHTVIRRPQHPSFAPEVPYYFIAVKLDEGPLLYSRLIEAYDPNLVLSAKKVQVSFIDSDNNQKLPFFSISPDD